MTETEPPGLGDVACDESGYEGDKLIGGTTDVFAYGSVQVPFDVAAECMAELRRLIKSPATEYKATHVLRPKHRAVLVWLLGPKAPLAGQGLAYVVDKTYFVVHRLVAVLGGSAADADALYLEGSRTVSPRLWHAFLAAGNELLRSKEALPGVAVESFFGMVEVLAAQGPTARLAGVLDRLRAARVVAEELRAQLDADRDMLPPADPLIPALVSAAGFWAERTGEPLSIVHDEHKFLSAVRVAQLTKLVAAGSLSMSGMGVRLRLRVVDSFTDPRVQLADILAGIARKAAAQRLRGHEDPELDELLRPYVDPASVWRCDHHWSALPV